MVLGVKSSKHKKVGPSIKVDYIVHVQEIRPWPPSEPLRSLQTVFLQWENTDDNSRSFLSVAGDSNIVFNESFMLPLTLYRSKKSPDKFRKNYLEFSLCEPRKDKSSKAQVLGTAILNLADYGLVEDVLSINAPLNMKKSVVSNSYVQPELVVTLEVVEKYNSSNSSPSVGLSLDNDADDDDSENAFYTDDDASSRSSRTASTSTFDAAIASSFHNDKNGYGNAGVDLSREQNKNLWLPSTNDASSAKTWNKVKDYVSLSKLSQRSMTFAKKKSDPPLIISAPISTSFRDSNEILNEILASSLEGSLPHDLIGGNQQSNSERVVEDKFFDRFPPEPTSANVQINEGKEKNVEDGNKRPVIMRSDTLYPNRKAPAIPPSSSDKAPLKHVKSVKINGSVKPTELDIIPNGSQKKGKHSAMVEKKEPKGDVYEGQNEWKTRVEMLEGELREAAVVEVGLYSVVPEHSSSINKVHAPARRLSRFYSNACGEGSQAKRASAARAAVSGLVLVSRACGNDVSRLTFWLSNSIMLRSIISKTASELPHSNGPGTKSNAAGSELTGKIPRKSLDSLTKGSDDWEDVLTLIIALEKVESWLFSRIVESVWWQAFMPHMQPKAVKGSHREKGLGTKKTIGRRHTSGSFEQGKLVIELWKNAFRDACERLCPIRAGGRECGCLSQVVKLVMGQLVNRLDMAMFNAILRESAEETTPMDPVSDPITDSKVLPVPAGQSSFGSGAQLKNVIGNWSRWLTDLYGLEDDSNEDSVTPRNGNRPQSFKAFRLLRALSDLMMLPFGMLADASTRKEVCPMFGPTIIKRVLNNFVPDEFSPHPIPRKIIDAINSEEKISDTKGEMLTSFPCTVCPIKYSAPAAALLACAGEVGSQVVKSSRLNKSYMSDDELDVVDSSLTSIIPDSCHASSALARLSLMPKAKGGTNVVRYQLLREIWKHDE